MMILIDKQLSLKDQEVMDMYARYLAAMGIGGTHLSIMPEGTSLPFSWMRVTYEPKTPGNYFLKDRDGLNAHLFLSIGSADVSFVCDLRDALRFAVVLLTTEFRERAMALAGVDDVERAFAVLNLDSRSYWRPRIGSWAEGLFASPEGNGFAAYYVDTHGELSITARSTQLAPIPLFLAAKILFQKKHLVDRVLPYRRRQK